MIIKHSIIYHIRQNKIRYFSSAFLLLSGFFSGITTALNFSAETSLDTLLILSPFIAPADSGLAFSAAASALMFGSVICLGGIFLAAFPFSVLFIIAKGFALGLFFSLFCFSGLFGFFASLISLLEAAAYVKLFADSAEQMRLYSFRLRRPPREKLLLSAPYIKKCVCICLFSLLPAMLYAKMIVI